MTTENGNEKAEKAAGPITLSIDQVVEKAISESTDKEALLRTTMRDNILVSRSAQKMVDEYTRVRNEVAAASRTGNGPIVFTLRRILMESEKRLSSFFGAQDPAAVKPTQAEAQS